MEQLEGTPLYSLSETITEIANFSGAAYLLLAPKNPTKALVVLEPETEPSSLKERSSEPVKISGRKELMKADALLKHVKDTYQMDLQTSPSGEVIVLRAEKTE